MLMKKFPQLSLQISGLSIFTLMEHYVIQSCLKNIIAQHCSRTAFLLVVGGSVNRGFGCHKLLFADITKRVEDRIQLNGFCTSTTRGAFK